MSHHRSHYTINLWPGLLSALLLSGNAVYGQPVPLTHPLNFSNTTNQRIMQTVTEQTNNEKSVASGDFDNDGDPDVAIAVALSDFNQRRNKLYRNDNGVFMEISGTAMIPAFASADVSRTLFFRDFDADGWDDLYIVNDQNVDNDLYLRNNHPGGVFAGFVNETSLRLPNNGNLGASCTGFAADVNNDGFLDIYAGNYPNTSQDRLIINDGTGFFSDLTGTNVPSDQDYTVHVEAADMNGDGKLDVILANDGNDPQFIYYNDNQNQGSATGDFSYPGSVQQIGSGSNIELVIVPVDVDGDGDLDLYWSNALNSNNDRILRNDGNGPDNRAQFTTLSNVLPASVTSRASRKVTVADFNNDRRSDLLVMFESASNGRPVILRNLSHANMTAFIDWTPGNTFPDGPIHRGWHALAMSVNGDNLPDIFLGGFNNDHFFDSAPTPIFSAAALGGVLPPLFNSDPVAVDGAFVEQTSSVAVPWRLEALVRGTPALTSPDQTAALPAQELFGAADAVTFALDDAPAGAMISLIAASCGDVSLTVRNASKQIIASSDRGAALVEEFVSFNAPGGPLQVALELLDPGACTDLVFSNGFEDQL